LHPEIVYLPCFSHQVNLCVGDIFKESDNFDVVANNACKIATYFTSKTHTYFIGKLRDEQQLQYRKYVNLIRPCETRWNSYFYCLTSILNTKEALKVCNFIFLMLLFHRLIIF
jgi:hypothetical protein